MLPVVWIFFILLTAGLEVGCSSTPGASLTGTIRYFNIRTEVAPRHMIVQIGDEIRWQNLNQHPVRLRMLGDMGLDLVACGKGFSQLGVLQDTVTIAPMQYVSLCFSKPTTMRFNVWLDVNNPQGAMTPTGSIRVEPSDSSRRTS
jgi:hypothetical protein